MKELISIECPCAKVHIICLIRTSRGRSIMKYLRKLKIIFKMDSPAKPDQSVPDRRVESIHRFGVGGAVGLVRARRELE